MITVIVIFYNMQREARRTLFTLTTAYQRNVTTDQYEVIAIDNGSSEPLDPEEVRSYGHNFRYLYQPTDSASPAAALNRGIREAKTPFVMCLIDGARMLSPGILSHTLMAIRTFNEPFVYTIAMHLGKQVQHKAMLQGYNQQGEDRLLEDISWRNNGYLLFNISCLGGSSNHGLSNVRESGCFTIKRDSLLDLGGFDERFISPGGGFCALDLFKRIVEQTDIRPIVLLGEATFHQFHGGTVTNTPRDQNNLLPKFRQEYQEIRGEAYRVPTHSPHFWGHIPSEFNELFRGLVAGSMMPQQSNDSKVKANNSQDKETVIAILGMHRSGTSCLAGSLQAAGLFSGKVKDRSVANSKGNRENIEIMALNDAVLKSTDGSWDKPSLEIKWSQHHSEQRDAIAANYFSQSPVWMFKDPRTLLTLQFWQEGINNLEFIGTFRHPLKVAMSLYQRTPNSITLRQGIKLWCHYNSLLLQEWQKSPFPLLCFDLPGEQYFEQLEQVIAKLGKYAHLSVSEAKKFYESKLVHQENIIAATELSCHDDHENNDAQLLAKALKLYQDLKLAAGIRLDEELPDQSAYIVPLSETIAACEAGIKLQPNNPHLYFILGNIQYKQQDFPAAIASYQQTLKIDSEYCAVYQNLADSLTRLERLDEAINIYQKILKLQPDNFKICCILGKIYQKQGKSAAAISHCQKAIAINPKYVAGYNRLANIQRQIGEIKAAITYYRQSLELNPQQYEVCVALANSLFQIGQGEEATIFFEKAQELNREHPAAANGLGSLQRQQGNYVAAVEYFSRSLKLDPQQYNIEIALGHSLFQLERFTEAAQAFQNAIALDDQRPDTYTVLGNVQSKSGNIADAIASYEKAIELNPKQSFIVYKNLGDCLSKQGKTEKAIAAYQEALKLKPDHKAVRRSLESFKLIEQV
ncbi:MAG: tetratricopeptide repeat protein [Cyanobacteria bacterium P01_F01_bin.143]